MAIYLYEFLYRGQSDGTGDYQVILAETATDGFGGETTRYSNAMTPAQAVALGYPMPTILSGFNAGLQADNAALKDQVAGLPPPASPADDTGAIIFASYVAKQLRVADTLAQGGQIWQAVKLALKTQGLKT